MAGAQIFATATTEISKAIFALDTKFCRSPREKEIGLATPMQTQALAGTEMYCVWANQMPAISTLLVCAMLPAGGQLAGIWRGGHRDSTPVSSTHVKSGGHLFYRAPKSQAEASGQASCHGLRVDANIAQNGREKKKKKSHGNNSVQVS